MNNKNKVQEDLKVDYKNYFDKIQKQSEELLTNIKTHMPELEKLLEKVSSHWHYEDYVYRFLHNSFKCYYAQSDTLEIVNLLKSLAPEGISFNEKLEHMLLEGTGIKFSTSHNRQWEKHTRPIIEVFLHCKFFLEMAVKYGKELKESPTCLPSGYAALLYFYGLR